MRQKRTEKVSVIGAGLAGSEAAFHLGEAGFSVDLYEMRPVRKTEAHVSSDFAELVCSNSFGSDAVGTASKLLKSELESVGAFVLGMARQYAVPAGASLAMDRELFSKSITNFLSTHPRIKIHREEMTEIPSDHAVVLATGPLTSEALSLNLKALVGEAALYFYDAISPIVLNESLDLSKMFFANRYDKGESPDFLNIPLPREIYETFVDDLLSAEVVLPHDFEEEKYFEGCMPIEALAKRGRDTLRFGPLKPVGLRPPKADNGPATRPYAVIQLRAENRFRSAFNLVGFQTKMKYKDQERVFRKLPGLETAEFSRLGSMHRNTFLDSPRVLFPSLQLKVKPNVFVAGQLTGTEGYLEATASGWLAAVNAARFSRDLPLITPPADSMLGALVSTISDPTREDFQPLNANFGLLPPIAEKIRDKALRRLRISERALSSFRNWWNSNSDLHYKYSEEDGQKDPMEDYL